MGRRYSSLIFFVLSISLFQAASSASLSSTTTRSPTTSPTRSGTPSPSRFAISRTSTPTGSPTIASGTINWAQYGYDSAHSGVNSRETILTTSSVSGLRNLWKSAIDGASITQPLVVTGLTIGGVTTDVVYVATEGSGTVFAFNAASGTQLWKRVLGFVTVSSCTDVPGGKWGVGGTPVADTVAGVLYVVALGRLHSLSLTTGAETSSAWPTVTLFDDTKLHNWGALTLYNGLVYFALAGMCDHPTYYGQVLAISTTTAKVAAQWLVVQPSSGATAGGIWGYGGVPLSPAVKGGINQLWTATGNVETKPEFTPYGESVVRLNPGTLNVTAYWSPGALVDNYADGDLGGSPNVFTPAASSGCKADYLVTAQHKSGVLFLLNASKLTKMAQYQIAPPDGNLINEASYDPTTNYLFVTVPSDVGSQTTYPGVPGVSHGLLAMKVTSNCLLQVAYSVTLGITSTSGSYSSAVIGGGVVYFSDGAGRKLHAVNAATGQQLWSSTVTNTVYVAPTVANGKLYAVDFSFSGSGFLYAYGL